MPNTFPFNSEPTHDRGTIVADATFGGRTTATQDAEGRIKPDIYDRIFLLEPRKHPLVTLLTSVGKVYDGASWTGVGLKTAPCTQPEFKWMEDVYGGRFCKVSASYASSGAVTISVSGAGSSSAHIFTPGDVVMNARTGERMLVATIASTTTITVAAAGRAFGTTAAAAGAAQDDLYRIGNVNEEFAGSRQVNTTRISSQSNYTQIFRKPVVLSETSMVTDVYGDKDMRYLRQKTATEHALEIEDAYWFGEKKYDTNGTIGSPRRATGGVEELILGGNSYVQDQGGTLTAPDMITFIREATSYEARGNRVLFAGGLLLQAVSEISRGQMQTVVGAKTYGVEVNKWVSPFGTINIVHNPRFTGTYAGYGFLLDMGCFRHRVLRPTKLRTNIQANDADGQADEWITECGLERKEAPKHALIKNVLA